MAAVSSFSVYYVPTLTLRKNISAATCWCAYLLSEFVSLCFSSSSSDPSHPATYSAATRVPKPLSDRLYQRIVRQ